MMNRSSLLAVLLLTLSSCNNSKGISKNNIVVTQQAAQGPPTYIYQTRNNYNDKVPVLLSEDKLELVSYPDPADLKKGGRFTYPTPLAAGYLLDNRGINKQVAFLTLSYEEYAALPQKPDRASIMSMILDKDPLISLYACGSRNNYNDTTIVEQLNAVINQRKLAQEFDRIK